MHIDHSKFINADVLICILRMITECSLFMILLILLYQMYCLVKSLYCFYIINLRHVYREYDGRNNQGLRSFNWYNCTWAFCLYHLFVSVNGVQLEITCIALQTFISLLYQFFIHSCQESSFAEMVRIVFRRWLAKPSTK